MAIVPYFESLSEVARGSTSMPRFDKGKYVIKYDKLPSVSENIFGEVCRYYSKSFESCTKP